MIRVRLQIDDRDILDTIDGYGLVYVSADRIFSAPIKEFEKSSYPEEEGEHLHPKTTFEAFDYKVTWFVKVDGSLGSTHPSLSNANAIIARFNSRLHSQEGDVKTFRQVTFYDDYKKVKIVGTPSPIREATEFWRDQSGKQHDVVCVEWVIRVSKPSLCDFNLE